MPEGASEPCAGDAGECFVLLCVEGAIHAGSGMGGMEMPAWLALAADSALLSFAVLLDRRPEYALALGERIRARVEREGLPFAERELASLDDWIRQHPLAREVEP